MQKIVTSLVAAIMMAPHAVPKAKTRTKIFS
jgi:hypothetical protein